MNLEKSVLDLLEGLSSVDFNVVLQYSSFLLVIFWLVVVTWVWFDSSERTDNVFLRVLAVIVVLVTTIPGLIVYLILRPRSTSQEQYWSDLERRYLMYETAELQDCEVCGVMLQPGFVYCPSCRNEIKVKCSKCGVNIDKKWGNCPFCGEVNPNVSKVEEVVTEAVVKPPVKRIRYETFSEFARRQYYKYVGDREAKKAANTTTVASDNAEVMVESTVAVKPQKMKKGKRKNRNKNKK